MESNQLFSIRKAVADDVPLILQFILDLAEYEQLRHEVVTDEDTLRTWIFERHGAEVLIAQEGDEPVGFALYFHNFSTFLGRCGIYLEDLFVRPEHRGKWLRPGPAQACWPPSPWEEGCGRLEWWCLDWNKPSIDFYLLPPRPAHGRVDVSTAWRGGPHQSGQGRLNRGI
ncbi:MAG: N-acetyltransferase family protein [Intestinimonas sp.]